MLPSEVIAMRDRLAAAIAAAFGIKRLERLASLLADWLIESGWVTSEPERKDDDNYQRAG